jgi:hypothetical protein
VSDRVEPPSISDSRTTIYLYKLRMMAGRSQDCVNCLRPLDHDGSEDANHLCAECKLRYWVSGYSETSPPPPGSRRDDQPGLLRWYGPEERA